MGIFINLAIIPDKIDRHEWETVYKESLELINEYPFLDRIVDNDTYSRKIVYTDRTKERELKYYGNQLGWYAFGDAITHKTAEEFTLIKDLGYYQKEKLSSNCDEVLFSLINWHDDLNDEIKAQNVNWTYIFNSKTQGYPYHIYILAIACLIESRFPHYAVVSGDVSRGQMQKAIDWANDIMKKHVQLTDRADNEKLLKRIKNVLNNEYSILEAFMRLTINPKDTALGDFIRQNFSAETIVKYNTKRLKMYDISMIGFENMFKEYFELGFDLATACDICVLNEEGCRFEPVDFMKKVMESQVCQANNNSNELLKVASSNPYSQEADTISSLFSKVLVELAGYQNSNNYYMSLEEITKVFCDKFAALCDVNCVMLENTNRSEKSQSMEDWSLILEILGLSKEESISADSADINKLDKMKRERFDIENADDLILWQGSNTILPRLEEGLKQIKIFVEKALIEEKDTLDMLHQFSDLEKMQQIIRLNQYFYICREMWGYIEKNIKSEYIIDRVFGVLIIKADESIINKMCKAVLNNLGLFNKYILD